MNKIAEIVKDHTSKFIAAGMPGIPGILAS